MHHPASRTQIAHVYAGTSAQRKSDRTAFAVCGNNLRCRRASKAPSEDFRINSHTNYVQSGCHCREHPAMHALRSAVLRAPAGRAAALATVAAGRKTVVDELCTVRVRLRAACARSSAAGPRDRPAQVLQIANPRPAAHEVTIRVRAARCAERAHAARIHSSVARSLRKRGARRTPASTPSTWR